MRNSESNANRYLAESIRGVRAPKRERNSPVITGHYVLASLVFIAVLMLGARFF